MLTKNIRLAFRSITVLVAFLCSGIQADSLSKVPVPANGAYFGAAVSPQPTFGDFQRLVGKPIAIQHIFYDDHTVIKREDGGMLATLRRINADSYQIPMITLDTKGRTLSEVNRNEIHPMDNRPGHEVRPDEFYRNWAATLKAYGKPVFLRWNQEMNAKFSTFICTNAVSGRGCKDADTGSQQSPGAFISAWRHIHWLFQQEGATNVSWVWCPDISSLDNLPGLYPGDDYVDWTCLDGYNWAPRNPWKSFTDIFSAPYQALLNIAPNKPIMIGEFNSGDGGEASGTRKAAWLRDAFAALPTRFPHVKAVLLFNVNAIPYGGLDWRVEHSPAEVEALKQALSSSYFVSAP